MRLVRVYFRLFVFVIGIVLASELSAQELIVYDAPGGLKYSAHNDDYTVKVRVPGGEWKDLFEYEVEVDLDTRQKASMVSFDFSGEVEVYIRKNNGSIQDVRVRPQSFNIVPEVNGQVIGFKLDEAKKLSVEFNGDRLHNLHVFANSIMMDKPKPKDEDVIYFGPGIHQPGDQPGDVFHVASGKTVFIDGGAVVKAKFMIDKAHDVKILGHGIVWQPERGVEIRHSKNITIDGPIFVNPRHYTIYGGQTTGLTVRNIKSFSSGGWTDGIDLMSCSDVVIDDVFMRNSDDCIAIYGHRWDFYGSARNYIIQNSILWADVAHPTNIGLHGNAEAGGDTLENILFRNIDILEHDEDDRNYQGCLAISAGDNNLVRDITYEDIRIEDIQEGQLFNFRVYFNEKYGKAPGRGVEDIVLTNITYNGLSANPSLIKGYNNARVVSDVRIEGLKINSKEVYHLKDGEIEKGPFAKDVEIRK